MQNEELLLLRGYLQCVLNFHVVCKEGVQPYILIQSHQIAEGTG